MASQPDVSIVIVNWNVRELLRSCLESIRQETGGLACEVIVVDNASSDRSAEMVCHDFLEVKLIANARNVGFARANNQGFTVARGRFIFILNPDTILVGGGLRTMMQFLEEHPGAGAVGPRLCTPDGVVQMGSARRFLSLKKALWCDTLRLDLLPGIGPAILRKLVNPYDFTRTQPVEAICGAAMLVRKEVLDAVGGFDNEFIHCGEDLELCLRIRQSGRLIFYMAEATVIHFAGRSAAQAPVWVRINAALSDQLFIRKSSGPLSAAVFRLVTQCILVPLMIVQESIRSLLNLEPRIGLHNTFLVVRGLMIWKREE